MRHFTKYPSNYVKASRGATVNVAEIGYAIGHQYWQYITSEEYGPRTNTHSAVGTSILCDMAIGGKYMYAFMQAISSYYYSELRKANPEMPSDTGYMLKFYKNGDAVCADVFNIYGMSSGTAVGINWDIGDQVIYTFVFDNFASADIESASREIAAWYDDHVQDAIDAALAYSGLD